MMNSPQLRAVERLLESEGYTMTDSTNAGAIPLTLATDQGVYASLYNR